MKIIKSGQKGKSILIAILMITMIFTAMNIVTADSTVDFSVVPSSQTVSLGQTFTVGIYVDPDGNAVDSLSTDWLWWDHSIMKLESIALNGQFVSGTTPVLIGQNNYTALPPSGANSIPAGQTKVWNYTLGYNLALCDGALTTLRIPAGSYGLKINGKWIVNVTGAGISYYNLTNWTAAGADTAKSYINITIKNNGGGGIAQTYLYMRDSHKRFLGYSNLEAMTTTTPNYFANLTFKAIGNGVCNFHIAAAAAVMGGSNYPVTTTNGSVTVGHAPTITTPNPANTTTGVNPKPTVSAYVSDQDGNLMEVYLNMSNNDLGPTSDHWVGTTNLTASMPSGNRDGIVTYGKRYNWTVWVTDGNFSETKSYWFVLRDQYVPSAPTGFTATPSSTTQIDLDWTKAAGVSNYTHIVAKLGSYPTNRADGTNIYNGTGESYNDDGLGMSEHWYYRAWSFNTIDMTWSSTYAEANASTLTNQAPVLGTPSPTNGSTGNALSLTWSIPISDPEGDSITWTINCSNGQHNNGAGGNGTKSLSVGGLAYSTTYTVWVNATDPLGSNLWTREWFTFTVRNRYYPDQPTTFNATAYNRFQIDLDWIKGTNADYTYIVGKLGSAPISRTDGTFFYNDTGTSTSQTSLSPGQHWYYAVWSWNDTDDLWSNSSTSADATTTANIPAAYGTPSPTNGSIGQLLAFTWSIPITDINNDLFHYWIQCSNGATTDVNGAANGTKSLALSGLAFETLYTIWVNTTDGYNWTRAWYTFTTKGVSLPTGITATAYGRFQINLTWTKSIDADYTHIEVSETPGPWNISDGFEVYNDTGDHFELEPLYPGKTYYFCVWGYNSTQNWYSGGVSYFNESTIGNTPAQITSTIPPNGTENISLIYTDYSMNISDDEGDDMTLIVWGGPDLGNATEVYNETGLGNGTVLPDVDPFLMPENTTIYIWAFLFDGYNWTNSTFSFKTGSRIEVSFDLIYLNSTKTGYNFISLLYDEGVNASDVAELLVVNFSVDLERIEYWDPALQEYAPAFYNGSGSVDHFYEPGDVMLVTVLENDTVNDSGFCPTMSWQDIDIMQGTNWFGRTGMATTAFKLGENLTAAGINWTQLIYYRASAQNYSVAFLPAYTEGSPYNFVIMTGGSVFVATTETGTFRMFGW